MTPASTTSLLPALGRLGAVLTFLALALAPDPASAAPRVSLRAEYGPAPSTVDFHAFRVPRGDGTFHDPASFYGFGTPVGASANPPVDFLQPDTVHYLVLDDGTDLWLVVIVDDIDDGDGGRFTGTIESTGLAGHPMDFVLRDDPTDAFSWSTAEGSGTFDIQVPACCTGGFVLGPLPRTADWSISISYSNNMGFTDFALEDWGECAGDPEFSAVAIPPVDASTLRIVADATEIVDCAVADGDSDGIGSCCGDCDDADPTVYPGAVELCDGVLNDCLRLAVMDGADEPDLETPCDGEDSDECLEGEIRCVEAEMVCSDDTEGTLDLCDGVDNDCDPSTDDGSDEEMFGVACDIEGSDFCSEGQYICHEGALVCGDPNPDRVEECDGEDNDCDGAIDEAPGTCTDAEVVAPDAGVRPPPTGNPGDDGDGCGCRTAGTTGGGSAPVWLFGLLLLPLYLRRRRRR